ncbi:MAG: DUF4295 domain-containing protein [Salibacteraceae bacterium]
MAKKTVATLGKGGAKSITKVIKTVRSPKTGAYMFEEKLVSTDKVKEFISK